MARPARR